MSTNGNDLNITPQAVGHEVGNLTARMKATTKVTPDQKHERKLMLNHEDASK